MIALRDILIFSSLVLIAVVFIASLFPVREGVSPVPACSDCAFKLTGPYSVVQYGNYAAVQLGERQVARYGWAYVDGQPLRPGDAASCYPQPMYLWVVGGIAYVSCSGAEPQLGNKITATYNLSKVTVVVRDPARGGWSVAWGGSASGSRSGAGDASWEIIAFGPVSFTANSKCRISPQYAAARPGDRVEFVVECSRYLKLDITFYHGAPYDYCRNNVHVAWGSASASFCSRSNLGYATLWIDLATGQRAQPAGAACSPAAPTSVEKYSWGYVYYLNVEQAGNRVSFRGDGFAAQYGFSATVEGMRITVYVVDVLRADRRQGADVYFYSCS